MSLETALADLTRAVALNNELRTNLTEEAWAAVSARTNGPVKGGSADTNAGQNRIEARAQTESHTGRQGPHDPDWGTEDIPSDPVLRALLEACSNTEDEDRRSAVGAHLRLYFRSTGILRFADMDAGERRAFKKLMQRLLSQCDLDPAADDCDDWQSIERPADWGVSAVIPDAVLRALVETVLMIEDETDLSNGRDTLKQLLRGHAVAHFTEMDAEQREDAEQAMLLLLSGNHYHLEDWMWNLLYMPPRDERMEASEF